MIELGYEHDSDERILFIDYSKTSLKAVLLYNGNVKSPIPIAHAVNMKETYETMKICLEAITVALNITRRFAHIEKLYLFLLGCS